MEPMNLGSAPSSPASPGINPNFLPNFLLGDDLQPISPMAEPKSFSRMLNHLNQSETQTTPSRAQGVSPFATSLREKHGPPKVGLFDEPDEGRQKGQLLSSTMAPQHPQDASGFGSFSRINNVMEDSIYNKSNGNNDTFNRTEGGNIGNISSIGKVDSHWVTVFGFPPSALTEVLVKLTSCGPIVDKLVPAHGNFIHVKFNHLSEVSRALALNGKFINNNIIIGVVLHYNKDDKENNDSGAAAAGVMSSARARSLRYSFASPQSPYNVISPQNVPQKSSGLVTKAMEYIFGW